MTKNTATSLSSRLAEARKAIDGQKKAKPMTEEQERAALIEEGKALGVKGMGLAQKWALTTLKTKVYEARAEKGSGPQSNGQKGGSTGKGAAKRSNAEQKVDPKHPKLTVEQMGEMKLLALKAECEKRGIKLPSKGKKSDLITLITEYQKPKKAPVKKGPSIIGMCVEMLAAASEKKPTTKGQIFDAVCKAFPERAKDEALKAGMWKTVSDAVPVDLRNRKGLIVSKCPDGKGYWLEASEMTKHENN